MKAAPYEHPSLDYVSLLRKGIEHLEKLAGPAWTDYNTHDPGITILEQLCYALTDLAYRIDYPLPDLLAEGGGNPYADLYAAADILSAHAVTATDLRKLVIDVPGVRNAWIEKADDVKPPLYFHREKREISHRPYENSRASEPLSLKGLYRVWIEKSSDIDSDELGARVRRRLHSHRNLCEDFESVRVLGKQAIQVHARIEIGAVDDPERLLSALFRRITDGFSPKLRFYTLDEWVAAGKGIDEIFEGPHLSHGFIDDTELRSSRRRTEIRVSDLIRDIMEVEGVRAVKDLYLTTGFSGGPEQAPPIDQREPWLLALDPEKTPMLDADYSKFILEKDGLVVSLDRALVKTLFDTQLKQEIFKPETHGELRRPPGRDRKVGHYHSIQHQFPDAFAVNGNGLPANAGPQRRAQAKQLKAYLMFFDQLLANYFAQLSHCKTLFSYTDNNHASYFANVIEDPALGLDFRQPLGPSRAPGDLIRRGDGASHRSRLQQMVERPDSGASPADWKNGQRKNRFLNHLLARFAEPFTDYALALYGSNEGTDSESIQTKLIQDKQAFLQNYPRISSARGTAFDYLRAAGPGNRSGLEQRVRHKLGISDEEEDFYLVEHILLRPMPGDEGQSTPLLAEMQRKDPYSLQLSFVLPQWPERFSNPRFKELMERTLRDETPAHLSIYVHWLNEEQMAAFKITYHDWLRQRRDFATGSSGREQPA